MDISGDDGSRKHKNRILQLGEIHPGNLYKVAAQYGTTDHPVFVMEITINDQVQITCTNFQLRLWL